METTAINAASISAANSTNRATTHTFSDMSSEDFFALLIQQLQSQDPLKPTDNQQLLEQMSSIRQMEQSAALNKTLGSLASEQRFGATAGLIGHYVSGTVTNDSGTTATVQGVVTGVKFTSGGDAILELHNGHLLPASKVELVTLLENVPDDVLAQIEAETAAAAANGSKAVTKDSAAIANQQKPAASRARPGDWLRGLADSTDRTSAILSSLLSPGYSVGVGK